MNKIKSEKSLINMDNIKIIFFDIDGTLIDMNRKCISENTLKTLIRLKQKKIILCIATGRSPLGLPHLSLIHIFIQILVDIPPAQTNKIFIFLPPICFYKVI